MSERQRCVKAAVLLSRLLLASATGAPFGVIQNKVEIAAGGEVIYYESVPLRATDIAAGALMLLRGMATDLADCQEVETEDVARLVELFTSTSEIFTDLGEVALDKTPGTD